MVGGNNVSDKIREEIKIIGDVNVNTTRRNIRHLYYLISYLLVNTQLSFAPCSTSNSFI